MIDSRTAMELARADADLRHDVRQLLLACLSATETARRWQLVAIAPSLAMLRHVLSEPPRQPAQSEAGMEDDGYGSK